VEDVVTNISWQDTNKLDPVDLLPVLVETEQKDWWDDRDQEGGAPLFGVDLAKGYDERRDE
jgi:hypothetical protein